MTQDTSSATVNNEYTAEDIQVLGGREAVRRRPGMYIGSTDQRGLHHLIYEITYNSIDEAMAGYCTKITVSLLADGAVRVEDNGRGIPVESHPTTNISALETVMTILHAGAKFGGKTYQISGGLHGVGASVVNALSAWLKVDVKRDGKIYEQEYRQGIPQNKVTEIGETSGTGTTTTFLADEEIFGKIKYDFNALSERIREMAYLNKGLEISLRDEAKDTEQTFYFEGGIISFVRHINRKRVVCHQQPIYLSKAVNGTTVEAALQYNDGFTETIFSFANCVNTIDGGSHLTGFRTALTRVLNDYAHKNNLIKEDDPNLTGEDVREGLTAVISVKLPEPQFEGQTKAKLGNPEIKGITEIAIGEGLSLYLEEHPDDLKKIIDKCLLAARAREAARKARDLIVKKSGLLSGTLPGKLADCSDKDPSHCELYLVEGESAGGSAKQGRDRNFQAILPLRGKVLNVEKAPIDKMLAYEGIRTIITALGTGIDEDFDLSKLRYHRVILMSDADVDGSHIRTLLLTFFFRHMAELINQGHLFIAQPPLYKVSIGKTEEWIYSDERLDNFFKKRPFENVSAHSKDGAIKLTGAMLYDLVNSLRDYQEGLSKFEEMGIPAEISEILLQKDESFYRIAFSTLKNAQEISNWFLKLGYHVRTDLDPGKNEYIVDVNLKESKLRIEKQLFENPILHRCLVAYPKVKDFVKGKSYTILKNKREIGNDVPWYKLVELLEKTSDRSGVTLQRYKGLGEMNAEQLWETTMNPETRTLLAVNVEDATKTDQIFRMLMGEEVPPRKAFIQAHAKSVTNLDI
ncbi:MAG: DNA topoisomerase (ATP-hydrolyzing) subunit B [Chloroflexi bacterium]|nr:DNA topoisomerase (ATP-hydrolyzing) subunit B [Chloroflexota bacterium]